MASATPLGNVTSYGGEIAPGQQAWYRFQHSGGERARVDLRGSAGSCPVRASLLDAHGGTLAEIVSSASETEPFTAYFPRPEVSLDYYLRIEPDPSATTPCSTSAGYVFRLAEPEQPACHTHVGPHGEKARACVLAERSVPAYEARACAAVSRRYNALAKALARAHGRARRRLARALRAARRAVKHGCRY
jgi:hypothetical protein